MNKLNYIQRVLLEMAQQCNYAINFKTHENPEIYEAWFEEKSQLQVREYEGLFGFDCSDGKYAKTDADFNKYLVGRFEEEVASGWSLKSDAYERIQSLLIKKAPMWFTCVIDDTIDRDQYSFTTETEAIECCMSQDNRVIEQEQLLPKGIDYIGDPSYVLKEEYWHYTSIEMERGVFQDPNGITYALFRTLMGDGVFVDDEGGEYVVDSGCIAVLPACVCNEEDMESAYGEVFEMTAPFTAEWEPEDAEKGDICVDDIFIHTNPLRQIHLGDEDVVASGLGILNRLLFLLDKGEAASNLFKYVYVPKQLLLIADHCFESLVFFLTPKSFPDFHSPPMPLLMTRLPHHNRNRRSQRRLDLTGLCSHQQSRISDNE